ncbi:hypothetical protein [Runella salmonicolor]|nr:hypothetical protein [Runella salmonicolor]
MHFTLRTDHTEFVGTGRISTHNRYSRASVAKQEDIPSFIV